MNISHSAPGYTTVTLSRRNLNALLAKLDGHPPASACRIERECDDGLYLSVVAQEDADHYCDRHPGRMHQATEDVIS